MSLHRRAARKDANQPEIVQALRATGFYVEPISAEGISDLLVWRTGGPFILCEVKNPNGRNRATPAQAAFQALTAGCARFTARDASEAVYGAQRLHLAWSQRP